VSDRVASVEHASRGTVDRHDDALHRSFGEVTRPFRFEAVCEAGDGARAQLRKTQDDVSAVRACAPLRDIAGLEARKVKRVDGVHAEATARSSSSVASEQPRGAAPAARPSVRKPRSSMTPRSSV
jgi:hypothetical protein